MPDIWFKTYRLRYLLRNTPNTRPPLNDVIVSLILNVFLVIYDVTKRLCIFVLNLIVYVSRYILFISELQKLNLLNFRCEPRLIFEYKLFSGSICNITRRILLKWIKSV